MDKSSNEGPEEVIPGVYYLGAVSTLWVETVGILHSNGLDFTNFGNGMLYGIKHWEIIKTLQITSNSILNYAGLS